MLKFQPKVFIQAFVSLFVLGFGAWAFYEYYQAQSEKEQQEEQALFLSDVDLSQIKELRIDQKNNNLFFAMRPGNKTDFALIKPVQDLINSTKLSQWFSAIKSQKVQKISSENIDWKNYYLDSAPFVQLDLISGDRITFSVSKKSSFDGRYFIKKVKKSMAELKEPDEEFVVKGEAELFIGDSSFFSEVNEKDFEDFRSKKILPDLAHVNRLQFKGRTQFQLNWQDYKWSLEGANSQQLPLDSSRLDGYWTDLNALKAESIKGPVNPKNLKKYLLNKAQLILKLNYGDKEYTLKLSPIKEGKAFVSISHRDYIFEISKDQADKLLLLKKEIYDQNFPFHYKTNQSIQVERRAGKGRVKNSFIVKKEGENWKSKEGKDIDSEKLESLLDRVKELRGEGYKKAIEKEPLRSFTVRDNKGQLIFELKELSQTKASSWVQTNLWPERIAVPISDINKIFSQDIFIKKENKAILPAKK